MERPISLVLLIFSFAVGFLIAEQRHQAEKQREARAHEYVRVVNDRQAKASAERLRQLNEAIRMMDEDARQSGTGH